MHHNNGLVAMVYGDGELSLGRLEKHYNHLKVIKPSTIKLLDVRIISTDKTYIVSANGKPEIFVHDEDLNLLHEFKSEIRAQVSCFTHLPIGFAVGDTKAHI